MKIQFQCDCGTQFKAPEHLAGKAIRCKTCQQLVLIPELATLKRQTGAVAASRTVRAQPTNPHASASTPVSSKPSSAKPVRAKAVRAPAASPEVDLSALPLQDLSSLPPATPHYAAPPINYSAARRPQQSGSAVNWLLLGGISAAVLGLFAIVVGIGWVIRNLPSGGETEQLAEGTASGSAPSSSAPVAGWNSAVLPTPSAIPPRPTFRPAFPSGVQLASARYAVGSQAGGRTEMNIYLPPGDHATKSLGCVLVAPAGTNLLVGNSLDGADYHDETLPYAEAGYVALQYSLDGAADMENVDDARLRTAYLAFKAAGAGTLNTHFAAEFVKARLPEVDPQRIYSAGHSSAGTVSLLSAAKVPGIAGSIAFAPCTDPEQWHRELITGVPGIESVLPGLRDFDRQFSPTELASRMACPLFVFQSRADQVVSYTETSRFVMKVKQAAKPIEFSVEARGDHYNSMISPGIQQAIAWLDGIDSAKR